MFDFKNDKFVIGQDIETMLFGKKLILKNVQLYDGPVTLQLLPYGGIQSVYDYNLIINTKQGFIYPLDIFYDDAHFTTKDFIIKYSNLVNLVLPN